MLTGFDDYLIHQTPEPVALPANSDPNFYDRYFFNGHSAADETFFGLALGLYGNRRVMDAAFSVVRDGRQHVLRASRRAPLERADTRVGPIAVQVVEPMRSLRVRVDDRDSGMQADLHFHAESCAIEEPRTRLTQRASVVMDFTRFTQFGSWSGELALDGERLAVRRDVFRGCRDRSWGVRPLAGGATGAPGPRPQLFWLWAPIRFDDFFVHCGVHEDESGHRWHENGVVLGAGARHSSDLEVMARVRHRISWQSGTRRARRAQLELVPHAGAARVVELEPILTFHMRGLGYMDGAWGHGAWKGEDVREYAVWDCDELRPLDPQNLHVQQLCRARCSAAEGIGVLEQLVLGPHVPSGFKRLLDTVS